jgi:YHS domain-containing protein
MRRALLLMCLAGCSASKVEGYSQPPPDGTEIVDPVTKDRCPKTPLTLAAVAKQKTFYFCSAESFTRFRAASRSP